MATVGSQYVPDWHQLTAIRSLNTLNRRTSSLSPHRTEQGFLSHSHCGVTPHISRVLWCEWRIRINYIVKVNLVAKVKWKDRGLRTGIWPLKRTLAPTRYRVHQSCRVRRERAVIACSLAMLWTRAQGLHKAGKGKMKSKTTGGFNEVKSRDLWRNSLGNWQELHIKMSMLMDADREREASCHPDVLVFLHGWRDLATRLLFSTRRPEIGQRHFFPCKTCYSSSLLFFLFHSLSVESRNFWKYVYTPMFLDSPWLVCMSLIIVWLLCNSTFSSWDPWGVMGKQLFNLVKSYNDKINKVEFTGGFLYTAQYRGSFIWFARL